MTVTRDPITMFYRYELFQPRYIFLNVHFLPATQSKKVLTVGENFINCSNNINLDGSRTNRLIVNKVGDHDGFKSRNKYTQSNKSEISLIRSHIHKYVKINRP